MDCNFFTHRFLTRHNVRRRVHRVSRKFPSKSIYRYREENLLDFKANLHRQDRGRAKPGSGFNEGLTMAEVRTAIRKAMSGQDSRGPIPRDILSVNVSGSTLTNPILDFTGQLEKKTHAQFV